ncbi:hypothetical protein SAMN05444483_10270 [Salegentibacter echinorum]|uniref:Uncharacterized protein n=1 Tax=Salegentibacter echinorum TaxID=1073325 RepID=A0A1M5DQW4_SALEC|nr:hypothetical protein [Salegentibacter echinorum]SHF69274.1 hypothetical protein SAMN05444483_10270 [Salegentibacter echinorum]
MKNRDFYRICLLLGVVLYASGNTAFAFSKVHNQLDSEEQQYLQPDHRNGFGLIVEYDFSENTNAEDPFFGASATLASFFSAEAVLFSSTKQILAFPLQDQRKLILQQIYPFHFFW